MNELLNNSFGGKIRRMQTKTAFIKKIIIMKIKKFLNPRKFKTGSRRIDPVTLEIRRGTIEMEHRGIYSAVKLSYHIFNDICYCLRLCKKK